MAAGIVKINGKRIYRDKIVAFHLEGTSIVIQNILGETDSKDMGSASKAEEALTMLDNLTEIDDIDGL